MRQQCSSAAEDLQKAQCTIRQLQEQQVPSGWAWPLSGVPPPLATSCRLAFWGSDHPASAPVLRVPLGGSGNPETNAGCPTDTSSLSEQGLRGHPEISVPCPGGVSVLQPDTLLLQVPSASAEASENQTVPAREPLSSNPEEMVETRAISSGPKSDHCYPGVLHESWNLSGQRAGRWHPENQSPPVVEGREQEALVGVLPRAVPREMPYQTTRAVRGDHSSHPRGRVSFFQPRHG